MDLRGQKALVFGALGRAGTAVVRKFCEEGASVVLSARREAEGEEFTASLRKDGHDVSFAAADVTRREQVAAAVDATVEQFDENPGFDMRRCALLEGENVRRRLSAFTKLHLQFGKPQLNREMWAERSCAQRAGSVVP